MKKLMALLIGLVVVLTGCGRSGGTATGGDDAKSDTLTVVPYNTVESFDPYQTELDNVVTDQLYDLLVQRDADGTLVPCLAAEWEDSEDGMTTTMKLREDVTFSDGTPFNADAVIYNFKLAQESYYQTGALYFAEAKKVDDTTVAFTKLAPYTDTAAIFAEFMPIVSPTAYEEDKEAFAGQPVGTGPYTLERFDNQTSYVYLNAREDYFQGKPGFAHITVQVPLESSVALVSLQNGEVDFVEAPMSNSDLGIAEEEGLGVERSTGWSAKTVYLFGEPFTSDVNLGMAVTCAINKENAAKSNGELEVVPCKYLFAERLMKDLDQAPEACAYDPAKAKEYLEKSNYNGETLSIDVTEDCANIATSMQADLKAVGIESEIHQLDANTFSDLFEKGEIHISVFDSGTPSFGLEDTMMNFCTGGYYVEAGLMASTPEMDASMEKILASATEEERNTELSNLIGLTQDNGMMVPLYESVLTYVHGSDIKGCEPIWGATTRMPLWKLSR